MARTGYHDIAADLRTQIQSGTIPAGALIPSRLAIAQAYGVSELTAGRAVAQLDREGLVEADHGHGYRVKESRPKRQIKVGRRAIISARPATPEDAGEHRVPVGSPILVVRVHREIATYAADEVDLITS